MGYLNNLDAVIMAAYLLLFIIKRDYRILVCSIPLVIYALTYVKDSTYVDDVYAYTFYSALNITLSYYFIKRRDFIIFVPIITMASYNLLFAYDSWVNHEFETWIWRNHETITCILHAFLLLVFIEKFRSLVDACITHVPLLRNLRVRNDACKDYSERKQGEARDL